MQVKGRSYHEAVIPSDSPSAPSSWLGFLFTRLLDLLRPCHARLLYVRAQCRAVSSESSVAGGLRESPSNILHRFVVLCSERRDRCERCPRLHALWEEVAIRQSWEKDVSGFLGAERVADLRDCNGNIAEIDDLDAQAPLAVLKDRPCRRDLNADSVAVETAPSVNHAEQRAEQRDSESNSNEVVISHDAKKV
jgi:hypothetical protein